jgi:hypothetical protein
VLRILWRHNQGRRNRGGARGGQAPQALARKFFSYLGKIGVCPEKIFDSQNGTLTENFLATGGGGRRKKFLSALFFLKVPLRAWPPQLFEASYAPGHNLNNVMDWSPFCNQILCK